MFERPWHREVWAVLKVLDSDLFTSSSLLFAGGTRIVLDLGEYRESQKAEAAYKKAIRVDLERAIEAFRQDPSHQKRCFTGLRIQDPALLLTAIDHLAEELRPHSSGPRRTINFPVLLPLKIFKRALGALDRYRCREKRVVLIIDLEVTG